MNDELSLAPGAPTRLAVKLELLRRLKRDPEALVVARQLAARPDATANDHLTLARLLKATGAPDAQITAALDTASRLASADAADAQAIAQARRELLPPPPPRYPPPDVPARLASLGFRGVNPNGTPAILPPLVAIPAGPFLMGSDKSRDKEAYDNELPQHRVEVGAFQMAKYPVTVAEYALAVSAKAVREPPKPGG